jgi:hypothetical protein
LQNEKKIVPEPFRPRRQSSSPKCGKAEATRAWRPVKHAVPFGTCLGTVRVDADGLSDRGAATSVVGSA